MEDTGDSAFHELFEFSPQELKACGVKRKRESVLRQVVELDDALCEMLMNPRYVGVGVMKAAKKVLDEAGVQLSNEVEANSSDGDTSSDGERLDGEDSDASSSDELETSASDSDESSDSDSDSKGE